jgi:hypothetical protein
MFGAARSQRSWLRYCPPSNGATVNDHSVSSQIIAAALSGAALRGAIAQVQLGLDVHKFLAQVVHVPMPVGAVAFIASQNQPDNCQDCLPETDPTASQKA